LESKELKLGKIVDMAWHWRVEDGFQWKFCAGVLTNDYKFEISPKELRRAFHKFFKDLTGCVVYTKCPDCGEGKIVPRRSIYGYIVSCSTFPKCDFKRGRKKKE